MDYTDALRWTAFYKAVSWVSGLIGLAFVAAGLYLPFGGFPANLDTFLDALNEPEFVPLALIGFVVWQVGKTTAFYVTVTEAVDQELAERFDPELIKSDILSVLDERLAEMQTQIEGTRRSVESLEPDTAGDFEFDD